MKGLRLVAVAAALLASTACGGSGTTARITLELATSPMPGVDGDACSPSEESLPAPPTVACVGIELCSMADAGSCTPIPLARAGKSHMPPYAGELRIPTTGPGPLSFDAMSTPGPAIIRVVAYDATGRVVAVGTQSNVTVAQSDTPVLVRLERIGHWSCGPQTAGGTRIAPRALGGAVTLPDGEVLIFGGVQGTVDELGFRPGATTGATLQRSIELYDPRTQRVKQLLAGPMGLGRVLFASIAAPDTGPPYHVYVYGGYTAPDDTTAVLLLNSNQTGTPIGSPVVPTTSAMPADPVTITYDPTNGTASVDPLMLSGVPQAGFNSISEYDSVTGHAFLVLGTPMWMGAPETTTFTRVAYLVGGDGHLATGLGSINLSTGRLGGTVTTFGADIALVFGGTGDETIAQNARNLAGEVISPRSVPMAIAGGGAPHDCITAAMHTPTEVPDPMAFHTATRVAGGVILAGGLLVGGQDCPRLGVTTTLNPRPLVFLSVPPSLTGLMGLDVPSTSATTSFQPVIFHTATFLTVTEGTPGAVLLAGGATRPAPMPPMPPSTLVLEPVGQTGIVAPTGNPAMPFNYTPGPSLAIARWGHAATRMHDGRVVVVGGFGHADNAADGSPRLRALDSMEVLPLAPPPTALVGGMCVDEPFDGGGPPPGDAGPMDGAPHDAPAADMPPPADAGPMDAASSG